MKKHFNIEKFIHPIFYFIVHRQWTVEMDGVDQNLDYDGDAEQSEEEGSEEEAVDESSKRDGDSGGEDGDNTTVYLDVANEEEDC